MATALNQDTEIKSVAPMQKRVARPAPHANYIADEPADLCLEERSHMPARGIMIGVGIMIVGWAAFAIALFA